LIQPRRRGALTSHIPRPTGAGFEGLAEWDCAAQIQEERWTFEMRIPFKGMNFARKDNQGCGDST